MVSDDDDEYDDDYEDKGKSDDKLLRNIGMLCQKCVEHKSIIKRLRMDLILSKSHARQTKHRIRIANDWNDKEASFANSVSTFVKEYLYIISF